MGELRFCAGSNPARGVSDICDGENLWQWFRLEIRSKRLSSVSHTMKTIHHHHYHFLFIKLSLNFRHFRVFVFCHRAYLKKRKPQKIFTSSFFEALRRYLSDLNHFFKDFVCSAHNSESVAQSCELAFTIIG